MPKPVYALVGEQLLLQMKAMDDIRAQIGHDAQTVDIDGEQAELADVLDELRSFAMFGGGKIVVVRSGDEFVSRFREQLEQYVAKPCDSGTLVLRMKSLPAHWRIHKLIAKIGQIVPCLTPKEQQLPAWIIARAKSAHKLTIEPAAANLLADLIGADLGRIDNELGKLALQADSGRITADGIAGSVAFQREQEMWQMTDELTAGRPADAIRRWRHLVQIDPSTEFRAVTWLTIWLERLTQVADMHRAGATISEIAETMRIWPPQKADALLNAAARMGPAGIARAVDLLAELDRRTKTGIGDADRNVEQFILSLAADRWGVHDVC